MVSFHRNNFRLYLTETYRLNKLEFFPQVLFHGQRRALQLVLFKRFRENLYFKQINKISETSWCINWCLICQGTVPLTYYSFIFSIALKVESFFFRIFFFKLSLCFILTLFEFSLLNSWTFITILSYRFHKPFLENKHKNCQQMLVRN